MRYSSIREMDISNGKRIGVSLFVQGCKHHCKNCFNQETWDFNGGKEWTQEVEDKFLKLVTQPFVTRCSILGGEPMLQPYPLVQLIKKIKEIKPDIKIWLWSGYTYEEIIQNREQTKLLMYVDYLIDGRYVDELRDLRLKFRGSSNQRIIDVKQSLSKNKIIERLW